MLLSKFARAVYATVLIIAALILFSMSDDWFLFQENGLMENLQAVCLVIAAILFFIASLRLASTARYPVFVLSVISVAMLLRELDVEKFDLPKLLVELGSGNGRFVLLAPLGVTLFFMLRERSHYLRNWSLYLRSLTGIYCILAFVLVLCSAPFDLKLISGEHRVFFEEMFELGGYYYFAVAALVSVPALRGLQTQLK